MDNLQLSGLAQPAFYSNREREYLINTIDVNINRRRKKNFITVRSQNQSVNEKSTGSGKGWFYGKFVSGQTMADKVAKLKQDSKENKGRVSTLFDDSFQYTSWIEVHRVLTERGLPSIVPADAARMFESDSESVVLLDVREAGDFNYLHAKGATSVALFRLIQGNDLKSNLRRLGFALITDFSGTERNPDFTAEAEAAVGGDRSRTVIVMCGRGGSLETFVERKGPKAKVYNDPWRTFGISSRSLKACYELQEAGFTNVYHLKGGFSQWKYEGFPTSSTL